ncbi:MAG: translocation/assembly module TamB [Bacteroidetes bacterium]|nr:translocation/assembly module TamB [Bacteroidota bacterium]
MTINPRVKKVLRRVYRIIMITALVIIILLITIIVLIRTPMVQNFARKKIVSYLESKLHTRVEIGDLYIGFPQKIILKNIYLEDMRKDTLLYGGKIEVDISMFKLLQKQVVLNEIDLDQVTVKVNRVLPDSTFNFQYIINAFASKDSSPTKPADTASAMKFSIGKIHLQKIAATYRDDASGNDIHVFIGDFETHIKTFDPDHFIYNIQDISLSGVKGNVRQYQPILVFKKVLDTVNQHNQSSQPISLQLGTVGLNDIGLNYRNDPTAMNANIQLGSIKIESDTTDLQKLYFRLKQLEIKNTITVIKFDKNPTTKNKKENVADTSANSATWKFDLANLSIDNNSFAYDDDNKKPLAKGMDYNHLKIDHAVVDADDLSIGSDGYAGDIKQISFSEKSGFELKRLSTVASYDNHQAQLKNFIVQTKQSTIKTQSLITYESADMMSKHPGEINTDITLDHSTISARDILAFVPSLALQLKGNENSLLHVNGSLKGLVKDLRIPNLEVSGLKNTSIQISGRVKGLPDVGKSTYDIVLSKFTSTRNDIQNIVPAKSIPASIRIPERISVKGSFKGDFNQFIVALNAATSNGHADIAGTMNIKNKSYDATVKTNGLDLGYILKQDSLLGKVSVDVTAKGTGYDYKTMNSVIHARLTDGVVKGYDYKDLVLDANLQNGKGNIQSSIHNEDISFDLNADAIVSTKYPAVKLKLVVDTLNPHALHLLEDTLHIKLKLDVDFASTNPDSLDGNLKLYDVIFTDSGHRITPDTLVLIASRKESEQDIHLHAEMLDIDWRGQYKLTEVSQALQQTVNKYYELPGLKKENITPENWQLQFSFHPSPVVLAYMPSLKGSDSVHAVLQFNSQANDLDFALNAPLIRLNDQAIHKLNIAARTSDSAIHYNINVAGAGKQGFEIHQSIVRGYMSHNQIINTIDLKDTKNKDRYIIGGRAIRVPHGIKFSFNADSLLLNYEKWDVVKDNFVQYDSTGLIVHDLRLSSDEQLVTMNSATPSGAAPLGIEFDNFRIKTLMSFAEQDSLLLDGVLNGNVHIKNILSKPVFTSDLAIDDLAYKKDTIGDIIVKVNNEQANAFAANISLKGHENDVQLNGTYYTGENKMDMKLDLHKLNLASIKPFTGEHVKDISGNLLGSMRATGNLSEFVLNGGLHFDNAYIIPTISGEKLRLPSDTIEFDNDGFNFTQFTMLDSAGDKAILDGNVYTKNFKDYKFDLSLGVYNFRLVNAPKEPNRLFYGKLNLDAFVDMTGNTNSPKINAGVHVNKQTDFTLILPSNDPEVQEREGVVIFTDSLHHVDTLLLRRTLDSLSRVSELKGLDIAATIETDSSAQFTMIIDERNGDALTVRGRASLAGGIDKSGKTSLTGNYELESGAYSVSLSILKRKFNIQRGSTITWTGDPTAANIDITATYEVNTASIDLIERQLAGRSPDEVNRFKQKLPFLVNLKMSGELLKPVIKFDITLPADQLTLWPEVETKLQQIRTDESEMNKQVFALLLLNRFVSENPFESSSGNTDAATLARQSVSKILSDQINQLAGSLVQGVDINFDLVSDKDYSTGQGITQTRLDVAVSKKLFNDRIRVSVGSNFQLENTYQNQNSSNIAGDVSVDYRLSQDGRYMVRAYRKDQYETIVEGQVVETGVSFILTLDYDQFSELFRRKKKADPVLPPHTGHKKTSNTDK